jgi:Arm DNA-binding domain
VREGFEGFGMQAKPRPAQVDESAANATRVGESVRLGKIYDHFGLFRVITPTDCRYWRMRYQTNKTSREMAIGQYPDCSLLQARKMTFDARAELKDGIDPLAELDEAARVILESKRALEDTFGKAVEVFVSSRKNGWSEKHIRNISRVLTTNSCQRSPVAKCLISLSAI